MAIAPTNVFFPSARMLIVSCVALLTGGVVATGIGGGAVGGMVETGGGDATLGTGGS